MKSPKPLNKFWNRNQFFYNVRFKLLLKEVDSTMLSQMNYNKVNTPNSIPNIYFIINKLIFAEIDAPLNDFEKALTIATWLRKHIKGGKGLSIDSSSALEHMIQGGYGICSDFSMVFNNFCVINNIKVREWGVNCRSLNDEKKYGHAFNEVYCPALQKWILLDVSKGIYFTTNESQNPSPLSVTEVFTQSRLNKPKKTICFIPTYETDENKIQVFYYSNLTQPFVIDNYRNKLYDVLLKRLRFLPVPFIHGFAIVIGRSYTLNRIPLPA